MKFLRVAESCNHCDGRVRTRDVRMRHKFIAQSSLLAVTDGVTTPQNNRLVIGNLLLVSLLSYQDDRTPPISGRTLSMSAPSLIDATNPIHPPGVSGFSCASTDSSLPSRWSGRTG
jgi:hypothetical protein